MKVYPKVSDVISIPKGIPSGTLFVEITASGRIVDSITNRHPNPEDRARGYWTVPNLKAAHADQCDWLMAREHGRIVGVWKIDRTKGWRDMRLTPKKTWPTDVADGRPRMGCDLIATEEYASLIGTRFILEDVQILFEGILNNTVEDEI